MRKIRLKKERDLNKIWSEDFYTELAEEIELAYWSLLKDYVPDVTPPKLSEETEHRLERFVRWLARKHNKGNLHLGLTSSDIEDNVRGLRLYYSYILLNSKTTRFWHDFAEKIIERWDGYIQARTHLLPVRPIRLIDRFKPLLEAVRNIPRPKLYLKGIGGSVGIRHVQKHLGINDPNIIFSALSIPVQRHCHQTGNHLSEMEFANWLVENAAYLAKLANDVRQMFAFKEAENCHQDIASTAIVQKKQPNPWRWERISGMATVIFQLPAITAQTAANCLLERTLTNQSVLNYTLREAVLTYERMLSDAIAALEHLDFRVKKSISWEDPEIKMINLILTKKLPREEAYRRIQKEV